MSVVSDGKTYSLVLPASHQPVAGVGCCCAVQVTGGYNQLAASLEQVLQTVCQDVAIDKRSTMTTATIGQNITYVVNL